MSERITWLHISDIHFNPKTDWRDNISRNTLLKYLRDYFSENVILRPDFIFCTGDIAFGESSYSTLDDQYREAKNFFDELLTICDNSKNPLSKERLFVVPGNHDVNRNSINKDAQETLLLWSKKSDAHINTITQRFNDRNAEFRDTIKRLDEYAQFIKDYLPHQFDNEGRHHYALVCDFKDIKIGIAGFNSAWTCSGSEDDRNIWLAAEWQFNKSYQIIKDADIRIGLIHHPIDWLNTTERNVTTSRLAGEFDFWLHGHSHNAWVTPIQNHIIIAAGAVGAQNNDEFGINITSIDLKALNGASYLHAKRAQSSNWTIAPIENLAPKGVWHFTLPNNLLKKSNLYIGHHLNARLEEALQCFSSQPVVLVPPIVSSKSEIAIDATVESKIDLWDFVKNPKSTFIKAPPQYGQTCLAHYLIREAWRLTKAIWLYLDSSNLKPNKASIENAVSQELQEIASTEENIKCIVLDSWSEQDKDALKILRKLCETYEHIPIVCMQRIDTQLFKSIDGNSLGRHFDEKFLWALPRENIRKIVAAYNEKSHIGDEDVVTIKLVSDLEVLNLHRTPLNCMTLLKVSEFDFDDSPVNRSEMIKRVLFLLFNANDLPTYKSRPDLKDCEYVLGFFCERLIRENNFEFTRESFLQEINKCCKERLIDLETQIVFDILYQNNILVNRGHYFFFKFAYWIFYFGARRMHHNQEFAKFIFKDIRYTQYPELIEFYTGIDRRRDDALQVLIKDIHVCYEQVIAKSGIPVEMNPYENASWTIQSDSEKFMHEIADGVQESSLPTEIKDRYADRDYDPARPYDQKITNLLIEGSFISMMKAIKAGARALRNSDYVDPQVKRRLLDEILNCWEHATQVMLILLPILAKKGYVEYDGAGFVLAENFGDTSQERYLEILSEIPYNIVNWCRDDIFSRKMGPLLIDQLNKKEISSIKKHELILLLILQRPRDWEKKVKEYINTIKKNSFYLYDVLQTLRNQYRFGFASPQTLREIEFIIKLAATKHLTGNKKPGIKAISKIDFDENLIPPREV